MCKLLGTLLSRHTHVMYDGGPDIANNLPQALQTSKKSVVKAAICNLI